MKYFFSFIILSFLFFSCGNKEQEKVTATFENGNPKLLTTFKVVDENELKVFEKELYESGKTRMEGAFENEERTGIWKVYFEDGTLWSEGRYENGLRQGEAKNYFPNGKIRYEGFFTDDKKSGHWKFYNENGQVIEEKDF